MNILGRLFCGLGLCFAASVAVAQSLEIPGDQFGKAGRGAFQGLPSDVDSLETARNQGFVENLSRYGTTSRIGRLSGYVGLLDILRADGQAERCTGFLVDADKVLTNAHCVWESGHKQALAIEFKLGYLTTDHSESERRYQALPRPLERGDPRGLDYAILKLIRPANDFQPLELGIREVASLDPLMVVGHPLGEVLSVSRGGCSAKERAINSDGNLMNHRCATERASSGSPIFDAGLTSLVALHSASSNSSNHGVRMTRLLEASPILRNVFAPQRPDEVGVIGQSGDFTPNHPSIPEEIVSNSALDNFRRMYGSDRE